MKCFSCGSRVKGDEIFCRTCGSRLGSSSLNNNSFQSDVQLQNDDCGFYQSVSNSNISDEGLIDAYIGKNAYKIKQGGFSTCTFFFGALYVLYRKMWLFGLLWGVGSVIISLFLTDYTSDISFIVGILFSFLFKKLYLQHVRKKVKKIKEDNSGASYEQLMEVCRKNGGTTVWPVIIYIAIYILMIVLFVSILIETFKKMVDTEGSSSMENLIVDVPLEFEASKYNSEMYKSYSLINDLDFCSVSVSTYNSLGYTSSKDYLDNNLSFSKDDMVSEGENLDINDNKWYYVSVKSDFSESHYYAIIKDDRVYEVEFSMYDSSDTCKNAHNSVISSLDFGGE